MSKFHYQNRGTKTLNKFMQKVSIMYYIYYYITGHSNSYSSHANLKRCGVFFLLKYAESLVFLMFSDRSFYSMASC